MLWRGKARIYFNAWEEGPMFWSVDNGDPASEVKCPGVIIGALAASVVTKEKVQPRAWFEVESALVSRLPDGRIKIVSAWPA
jgi:hypothetical protein